MPLDPGDRYYRAETISPSIAAMEHPLCDAYGVGLGNFGSKGNENHLSGYHRSRNWILHSPDSAHGSGDYSIQLAADQGNGDDVSAFDFTPGAWGTADNRGKMKALTQRLISACQAHDPRVANLREVAGTLDGSHVVTWDCSRNAFKSPFDSSHLDHVHGSIYRSRTRWSQAGIVSVMLGVDMARSLNNDDMDAIASIVTQSATPDGHAVPAGLLAHSINLAALNGKLDQLLGRPAADAAAVAAALAADPTFIAAVANAVGLAVKDQFGPAFDARIVAAVNVAEDS